MALNFPDSPSSNQYYTDTNSGFTYQWNGSAWISVGSTMTTLIKELDNISGSFNGSTTIFSLTIGGSPVYPVNINQVTINLGGILQNAGQDFTISGDQITFTTAPTAGLSFNGIFYGSSVSLNVPQAGTIGTSALTTGGPIWNTGGDVRVAGIITVGSSSVTINGPANQIKVGSGTTLGPNNIITGIVTATSFYGDGSGLTGIGIGTTSSVNTSGIITASYFYGAGIGLTNIGGRIAPILYNPGIGQTNVGVGTNIVITFNKPILSVGNTITLRTVSAAGTITESFTVGVSTLLSISGGVLTINPTSDLSPSTTYYVVVPDGAYKDILNTSNNIGISSYYFQTAAAAGAGPFQLWSWGYNNSGQLGQNNTVQRSSPVQIPGTQWSIMSSNRGTNGDVQSAIKTDGTLWSWGSNSYNGLNGIQPSSPIQIPGTQWRSVSGWRACLATKTDGTLWSWGYNGQGGLGLNDRANRSSPHQIPGTQWSANTEHGVYTTYAIKTDGTLWSWGQNDQGQFGLNDAVTRSSPVQIPGTQWVDMRGSQYGLAATKTDGTLWSWGHNSGGEIGINDTVRRSSPTQIPGTQWDTTNFERGLYSTMARKTDGTLWTWGWNNYGQLGLNDTVARSSPTQIPGTQWSDFGRGLYDASATKTDGTLWVWGYNNAGSLGLNNQISYSSPTQVPGTQWSVVSNTYSVTSALKTL